MDSTSEASSRPGARFALGLGALGVVFGDIGTSPLYTIRECLHALPPAEHAVAVLGVLSLIVWSLIVVVSLKYTILVLRADNRGEGGIFALLALGKLEGGARAGLGGGTLLVLAGASMLCGEAVITPAITVLSAVEGIKEVWSGVEHLVVPLACLILGGLFAMQSRGTKFIGWIFGPVMLVWFFVLGALGFWRILETPVVLQALNPLLGIKLITSHPGQAAILLGAVVLAFTGVEALYADMGHFGRSAIVGAWYGVVLPGLVLNYFGQGAHFLSGRGSAENPFLAIAPAGPIRYALLGLSVFAAIIASQALISGAFSLVRQAIQLGFFPRLTIRHTNPDQRGQIFLPLINVSLALGSIATVFGFKSSSSLAAAYGIAVTGSMIVTTLALLVVMQRAWAWPGWRAWGICGLFLLLDFTFFASTLQKFRDGGWLPLFIATGLLAIMATWKLGKSEIFRRVYANEITEQELCDIASSRHIVRVRGTGVFMAGNPVGTPLVLLHHVKANKVLQETVLLLSIVTEEVPYVSDDRRLEVREIGCGVWRAVARYGYMESPDVSQLIGQIRGRGVPLKPAEVTYYFNREMIITGGDARMWEWQKHLYGFLSRNARQARDYYRLPPMQIIEVGLPIQL
ncbi:MAG: KUP/HAK/KT family potassium transporter [Verrucomicrobia bacterium]|nr:KUP/HAK/KT family potassium transporter [Verrucomicrobiota bacterium]